jgi:hypothetical protein
MIAEAAYFRAAQRGFNGGDPVADWIAAEAEVDALLAAQPATAGKAEEPDRQTAEGTRSPYAELARRLEEAAEAATRRLTALRRKLERLSGDARGEWQRDMDRLVELRMRARAALKELKAEGEEATRDAQRRADEARSNLADLLERIAGRLRG